MASRLVIGAARFMDSCDRRAAGLSVCGSARSTAETSRSAIGRPRSWTYRQRCRATLTAAGHVGMPARSAAARHPSVLDRGCAGMRIRWLDPRPLMVRSHDVLRFAENLAVKRRDGDAPNLRCECERCGRGRQSHQYRRYGCPADHYVSLLGPWSGPTCHTGRPQTASWTGVSHLGTDVSMSNPHTSPTVIHREGPDR